MKFLRQNLTTALFLAAFIFIPQVSSAYLTTSQTATRLNDTTILYTVSYSLGSGVYDMRAPIGATESSAELSAYVEYVFLDDGVEYTEGESAALVLSAASITDAEYIIDRGDGYIFTLVSLLTVPADSSDLDLSLQVTSLPFTLISPADNTENPNRLNDSELQYYVTPAVKI